MPSTYNGIGTHYYGKKNLQKRVAPCHSCGNKVELVSYDTRLWFVIFFIPIIPLKRKRILDYCPACTRHYAVEADKWETAKQLEVSGAQEKFRSEPTADNAIAAHQQMLHFHQLDDAATFQKTMTEKFADNAKVQAYLGGALTHIGKLAEAEPFFARALELRPDLPEARSGVARAYIRAGKLDEARALLDFLEKPGASKLYSMEPLDELARALQTAGRHNAALEIFAVLLKELPHLGEQKWFRKLVANSEKEPGGKESLLPKLKFSWKRFFSVQPSARREPGVRTTWRSLIIVGIILGVIGIVMAISNEYIRRHQTLYIVSGFKEPALVAVRGQGTVRTSQSPVEMRLPEGRYHATITGPVKQEVDFEIRSGYWGRFFDHALWILNVGGSAVLERIDAVYHSEPEPSVHSFLYGEPFVAVTGITHQFRELPDKAKVGTRFASLDVFRLEPNLPYFHALHVGNQPEALRFAEWRLRLHPEDERLLMLYFAAAQNSGQGERVGKFLRAGLTNRPILVQWHRYYQGLHRDRAHDAQLAAEYDEQLKTDATNSVLMYLRGRVAADRTESRAWFQRACDADPKNPFPFYARGYDRMATGDFAGAKTLLARAVELRPKQPEFTESLSMVRLALGEYAALEKELREELQRESLNYRAASRLCDVLVAQNRATDATEFARNFALAASHKAVTVTGESNRDLHRHVLYLTGDFATLERESALARDNDAKFTRFVALIELGRIEEAIQLVPLDAKGYTNPLHFLDAAIALRAAGNATEAARWLARALELMDQGDSDTARAAALLRKTTPPTAAELDDIAMPAESKAIVVATLAQLHPGARAELAALARKLNIVPGYPQHLIAQAMAAK
ncbi:MAG: tetratricopeptide repeat protein [Pedosphaera sp.]|nr:tetratricopeptide repeat protein [Pedosphaera sp.]